MPKARSLQPLPGGVENYPATLARLVQLCETPIAPQLLKQSIMQAFPTVSSGKVASGCISGVLYALSFAENCSNSVKATPRGMRFLASRDPKVIQEGLLENVDGVPELMTLLAASPSLPMKAICAQMQFHGFAWASDWQVRFRLRWLRVVDLVDRLPEGQSVGRYPEWVLTQHGQEVARHLRILAPT